jgi:hypothetical protein
MVWFLLYSNHNWHPFIAAITAHSQQDSYHHPPTPHPTSLSMPTFPSNLKCICTMTYILPVMLVTLSHRSFVSVLMAVLSSVSFLCARPWWSFSQHTHRFDTAELSICSLSATCIAFSCNTVCYCQQDGLKLTESRSPSCLPFLTWLSTLVSLCLDLPLLCRNGVVGGWCYSMAFNYVGLFLSHILLQ